MTRHQTIVGWQPINRSITKWENIINNNEKNKEKKTITSDSEHEIKGCSFSVIDRDIVTGFQFSSTQWVSEWVNGKKSKNVVYWCNQNEFDEHFPFRKI